MRTGQLTEGGMERVWERRCDEGALRDETHLWATDGAITNGGCAWEAGRAHGGADDGEGRAHAADRAVHRGGNGRQGCHGCSRGSQWG